MTKKNRVPPNARNIGDAVRQLREDQRMTLRQLAEKVGVSAPFLSDLEHGRRHTDKHAELADALNVDVDELKKLDSRISPDLKEWLSANPKLVDLLKDLHDSGRPVPVEALRLAAKRTK